MFMALRPGRDSLRGVTWVFPGASAQQLLESHVLLLQTVRRWSPVPRVDVVEETPTLASLRDVDLVMSPGSLFLPYRQWISVWADDFLPPAAGNPNPTRSNGGRSAISSASRPC